MLTSVILGLALTSAPGPRQLVDRIVAIVNDDVIILSELDDAENIPGINLSSDPTERRKQLLEQLINERLMQQQISEAKIEITEDELGRAIQDILRTNKITEAELKTAVEARGLSMGQYREDLKSQLIRLKLIDTKVRSRVVIPEAEIRAEYDRRVRDESKETLVRVRHVFLRWGESPDPNERTRVLTAAKAARQRILNGENFEQVAREVSQSSTAQVGGDLGEMNQTQMLPELAKAIGPMKPGDISQPIETPNGVHVVRLESRRSKASTTYAESRIKIYQELYQREVEAQMRVWLEELRKQAAVTINL